MTSDIIKGLNFIEAESEEIQNELLEINQNRSDFALVHFVVERHGPIEQAAGPRQRFQALRELQTIRGEVIREGLRYERCKREIERLKAEAPLDADLDIAEKKLEMLELEVSIASHLREFATLKNILNALPRYSQEEHQKAEAEYWTFRLTRQLLSSRDASLTGFDRGDLEAMLQATDNEILPGTGRVKNTLIPVPGVVKGAREAFGITYEGLLSKEEKRG